MLIGNHTEQWPLWYPQHISFMQALTCCMLSEEKHCPVFRRRNTVTTLGLACNKFEFRDNMMLISCMTLGKSFNAAVHRIAVSVQGSSTTSFCRNRTLPGASHWSLPPFPICKIGMVISSIPFLCIFWLWYFKLPYYPSVFVLYINFVLLC